MQELNIVKIKEIQLNILNIVDQFCTKANLKYYLGYGTLLGAIRHRGYIPWDDDIDIVMPRPDYEKFIKQFYSINNMYKVYSHINNSNFYLPFAKVSFEKTILYEKIDVDFNQMGVNIDIFPLDGYSFDSKKRTRYLKKQTRLRRILTIKYVVLNKERSIFKNILLYIGKKILFPVSYKKIVEKIHNLAITYDYNRSDLVGCNVWNYRKREVMDKRIFDNSIMVEFEGKLYQAPKEYDLYLNNLYGDYMKLPPVENREAHHSYKAYLKEQKEFF